MLVDVSKSKIGKISLFLFFSIIFYQSFYYQMNNGLRGFNSFLENRSDAGDGLMFKHYLAEANNIPNLTKVDKVAINKYGGDERVYSLFRHGDRDTRYINSEYITNGYFNIVTEYQGLNKVNYIDKRSTLLFSIPDKKMKKLGFIGKGTRELLGYDLRNDGEEIEYPYGEADKILIDIKSSTDIEVLGLEKDDDMFLELYLYGINETKEHIANIYYSNVYYIERIYPIINSYNFLGYSVTLKNNNNNILSEIKSEDFSSPQ